MDTASSEMVIVDHLNDKPGINSHNCNIDSSILEYLVFSLGLCTKRLEMACTFAHGSVNFVFAVARLFCLTLPGSC